MRIRQVKPEFTEFEAEFRGFFFGEGCLDLQRLTRNPRSLSPRARIGLNEKDVDTLHAIRERFGGTLYYRTSTKAWCWTLAGQKPVSALLDVLEGGIMPSAKREECRILRRAIALMPARGIRFPPGVADQLAEFRIALQRAKRVAA